MSKVWREAATLIIAARTKDGLSGFNYKVLCMKRSEKTSFMRNNLSFPGGAIEKQDETLDWLNYFEKAGEAGRLEELSFPRVKPPPPILKDVPECLQRGLSLRISAIRETFEELGVLLCRKPQSTDSKGFFRGFDVQHYQDLVHDHKITFLDMCKELKVVPDVWRLSEWSNWLTPTFYAKRRFDTMFYITTLDEQPPAHAESNEAFSYMWRTPAEYLAMSRDELFVPPPQFYEFSRLLNFKDIEALESFCKNREKQGIEVTMPVQFRCDDGLALTLPGDFCYPEVPNFVEPETSSDRETSKSLDEHRANNRVHRIEIRGPQDIKVQLNIPSSFGHCAPVSLPAKL